MHSHAAVVVAWLAVLFLVGGGGDGWPATAGPKAAVAVETTGERAATIDTEEALPSAVPSATASGSVKATPARTKRRKLRREAPGGDDGVSVLLEQQRSVISAVLSSPQLAQSVSAVNVSVPQHPIRPSYKFTWDDVMEAIGPSPHEFCGLLRDNWACHGPGYAKALMETAPFNTSLQLPAGARVYAEGNSFLAQLLHTVACANADRVWKLGREPNGNSILASFPNGATMLLIDNDSIQKKENFNDKLLPLVRLFDPTALMFSRVNFITALELAERRGVLLTEYPTRLHMDLVGRYVGDKCCAHECRDRQPNDPHIGCHVCVPGPVARGAEELVRELAFLYAGHSAWN